LYKVIGGVKWGDLPGGRLEFGETAEQTLKREVQEELNVDIEPIRLVYTWTYIPNETFQVVGVIYNSRIIAGELRVSAELDGYEWVGSRILARCFQGMPS